MTTPLSLRDTRHIFEKLSSGAVPERGLDSYAVGIDRDLREIDRQLRFVTDNEGQIKFLRGGYGCGKTFMARLSVERAQQQHNFVTSFVVVSPNDLKFHRFDEVYNKVVMGLSTSSCPRQALGDILDRWIGALEDSLIDAGVDENAEDFDKKVADKMHEQLIAALDGAAPPDFTQVLQTVFELKQRGELAEANQLLSWLAGSTNVSAAAKKRAGIKGEISSRDAMDYLRGVLSIVKAAGYAGMLIVIDEAETILRMRSDSRHKSLNGIRQILDAAGQYKGLLWLFTGTPDFFESRQGVAGLQALHDRIRFETEGDFATRKQPQLQLKPFDLERLVKVAKRLRELYLPLLGEDPEPDDPLEARTKRHNERIDDAYVEALAQSVTQGFRGDVGVVPRQFLRKLISIMHLVREEPDFAPMEQLKRDGYRPPENANLSPQEEAALEGREPPGVPDDGDELVPVEDVW